MIKVMVITNRLRVVSFPPESNLERRESTPEKMGRGQKKREREEGRSRERDRRSLISRGSILDDLLEKKRRLLALSNHKGDIGENDDDAMVMVTMMTTLFM